MTDLLPPELFPERPVRSDFNARGPSYAVRRLLTIMVLLLLVGAGLYWGLSGSTQTDPQDIPVIKADGTYKQRPEQPGGIDIPHQDVQVYRELDASRTDKAPVEHLLPPPEIPQVASPEQQGQTQPQAPSQNTGPEMLMTDKASVAPVPIAMTPQPAVAPSPAPAPQVQAVVAVPAPASVVPAPTSVPGVPKDAAIVLAAPNPVPTTVTSPSVVTPQGSGPVTAKTSSLVTATKPAVESLTIEKIIKDVDTPKAAKVAEMPAAVIVTGKSVTIQLASMPDQAAAEKDALRLQSKYASILGTTHLHVVRADLQARGIYYRIQGSAASEEQAREICASLKKSNTGCILVPSK